MNNKIYGKVLSLAVALTAVASCNVGDQANDDNSNTIEQADYRVKSNIYGSDDWLTYKTVKNQAIHQGDINLGKVEGLEIASVDSIDYEALSNQNLNITAGTKAWPGGAIPYKILDQEIKDPSRVRRAIAHWNAETNIKLIPYTGEFSYVTFISKGSGCNAPLGFTANKSTTVSVDPECSEEKILHLIGHLVGMSHEHNRPDRDNYIQINWHNITDDFQAALTIPATAQAWGEYDSQSVMHALDSFGNYRFKTSIVGKNGTVVRKTSPKRLSSGDISSVNAVYPDMDPNVCDVQLDSLRQDESLWTITGFGSEKACKAQCQSWDTPAGWKTYAARGWAGTKWGWTCFSRNPQ